MRLLLVLVAIAATLFLVLYLVYDKPRPTGESGARALALVDRIQNAVNQSAWERTRYIEWTFRGTHHYVWDKQRHLVQVTWDEHRVLLNANTGKGQAYTDGQEVNDRSLLQTANAYFTNDAFWLSAPNQLGGDRALQFEAVDLGEGTEGLLVTYLAGGVTPGDAYLWKLDETGLPQSYQMWVSILPIGGFEFSWEGWETLPTGAKVSTLHDGLTTIPITNLNSYQDTPNDIFGPIVSTSNP